MLVDHEPPPSKLTDFINASATAKFETTTMFRGLSGLTATVVSLSLSAKPLMSWFAPTLRTGAARAPEAGAMARTRAAENAAARRRKWSPGMGSSWLDRGVDLSQSSRDALRRAARSRPRRDCALDDPDEPEQGDRDEKHDRHRAEDEVDAEALLRGQDPDPESVEGPDVLRVDRTQQRVRNRNPEAGEERRQRGREAQESQRLTLGRAVGRQ